MMEKDQEEDMGNNLNKMFGRSSQAKLGVTLIAVGLILSACSSLPSTEKPVTGTLVQPTQTETIPAMTETAEPTASATETAEPTATETAVNWTESRYYEPGFKLEMEGSVEGVSIPFTIGLHSSLMDREDEPIVSIEANRPDTADIYAKFWMTMCWKKYEEQHPEAKGISFSQYMQLVKDGGGEIEIAAVDEATEDQNNKLLTFKPEKGFVNIAADSSLNLPEVIVPGGASKIYFGRNEAGQLVIVNYTFSPIQIKEQKDYDGYDGWSGEVLVNNLVSVRIGEAMELFLSAENKYLLSSRSYYSLTEFSLIDSKLYLIPQLLQPMWDSRVPFFSISQ